MTLFFIRCLVFVDSLEKYLSGVWFLSRGLIVWSKTTSFWCYKLILLGDSSCKWKYRHMNLLKNLKELKSSQINDSSFRSHLDNFSYLRGGISFLHIHICFSRQTYLFKLIFWINSLRLIRWAGNTRSLHHLMTNFMIYVRNGSSRMEGYVKL